jgi:hypothetical protein
MMGDSCARGVMCYDAPFICRFANFISLLREEFGNAG